MNKSINAFFPFFALLLASCAQIVSPTGGPRDIKPPYVVKYIPDSGATHFSSKEINIYFNEFIQLKDVSSSLIISPPLKFSPDISVNNRVLNIKLLDTLLPNTTYAINFGNSVADITEGNAIENFQYVFSTGKFIDSLSLSGTVQNAFDLKSEKGILVMLYRDTLNASPKNTIPSYFSKTKDDGSFRINNISSGAYKVFALKDADQNYFFNSQDEMAAFSDSVILINQSSEVNLFLFREIPSKQSIKKFSNPQYGKILLVFNKPAEKISITELENKGLKYMEEFSIGRDSLSLWLTAHVEGNIALQIKENDQILDTVKLRLGGKPGISGRGDKPKLVLTPSAGGASLLDIGKPLFIFMSQPVKQFDLSLISISDYKESIKPIVSFSDSIKRKLGIEYNFIPDSSYSVLIKPGAFTDYTGLTNDTLKFKFKVQAEKYYGNIKLKISIPVKSGKYILQLLDEKESVIRENVLTGSQKIGYDYLIPGKYRFKIIYDSNSNGKWDTGNYSIKKQPEKVIYFSKQLTIRSNWESEEEWIIK